jgi:hypothetical protein
MLDLGGGPWRRQCCESGSGAFLTLDPGSGIGFFPDSSSRILNPYLHTLLIDF